MIVLGIDPGTQRTGYGVVKKEGKRLQLIRAGIFSIRKKDGFSSLVDTEVQITDLIRAYKPDIVAIERIFFSTNHKTAIHVAEHRGIMVAAAAKAGVLIREFTPNEVKANVAGYGMADKRAVAKMVCLTLQTPELSVIDDASDALAIAIAATGELLG